MPNFTGPAADVTDPGALLLGYLDWYRDVLVRKIRGLSEKDLRTPLGPPTWAPLGLVRHLSFVERRWMRWGFAAQDVVPYLPNGEPTEWAVKDEPAEQVLSDYLEEVRWSRALAVGVDLDTPARLGGRFSAPEEPPTLGRILFHLLQEYARHVGQLDVVRELLDGETGE